MTQRTRFVPSSTTVAAIAVLALTVGWTPLAEADITRIVITRVESPTFEGMSFGAAGQYEKLRLRAFGEVDPADPRNHVIADIDLAPRNPRGMVEYDMDVVILKPVTLTNGNRRLLYYMNNRGNLDSPFFPSLGVLSVFNDGSGGNDPTSAAHAGNGFLMRQGYTIVSSGWDPGVAAGANRLTIKVPVAKNPDGSPVIGPSLEEFVIDNATTVIAPLTYPAAATDKSLASLTVRTRYDDSPVTIPAAGWEYVNALSVRLLPAGTPFTQGRLYEFTYPARDPLVAGLGFAATRDFAAFLRYADSDETGTPNPLVGNIERVYTFGISQPARYMRDFLHLGFNEDEQGHPVFDGILNWLGGGSGIFLNYRFAQAARTHRQHIGRWYPEREFPFANRILFDPITGRTDGRRRRCLETNTCPRIFEVNSANEYWVKAGSLLHTDPLGNDLRESRDIRFYLLSSLPHVASTGLGVCQQPGNPLVPNPGLRALVIALDDWVTTGKKPPASRVPRRTNGTLVSSTPQDEAGFPSIPGVTYNGLMTTGDLFDFGQSFDQGILSNLPPIFLGSPYPAFVPRADADGNDIAGIRLPEVEVPLATYTGWSLRAVAFAGDDLCDASGQKLDFAQTKAERLALGDPRPSIEERYPTHKKYVKDVTHAAKRLFHQRLLLAEDVQRYIQSAEASSVGR